MRVRRTLIPFTTFVLGLGSISIFGTSASASWSAGNVAPISELLGDSTSLAYPWSVDFDSDGYMYVSNYDGPVTVYAPGAEGDAEPVRTFGEEGLDVAVGSDGFVYGVSDGDDTIYVYAPGAEAADDPVITRDLQEIDDSDWWLVALDSEDNLYTANYGAGSVAMFESGPVEDSLPTKTATGLPVNSIYSLYLDAEDNMYVGTCNEEAAIYVFEAGWVDGESTPDRVLQGEDTGFECLTGITVDSSGDMYVANDGEVEDSIFIYASGWSSGNSAPDATLSGDLTNLDQLGEIDIDPNGNLVVVDYGSSVVRTFEVIASEDCDRCTGAGRGGGGPSGSSEPSDSVGSVETPDFADASGEVAGDRALIPGTEQPVAPIPTSGGVLPEVVAGQSLVTENGLAASVSIFPNATATGVAIEGSGYTVSLTSSTGTGATIANGVVTLARSGDATVSGDGFSPGSLVDVWAFSTPTFLGSYTVGSDGTFAGSILLPPTIGAGPHTFQVNGMTADGKLLSLNLGVQVVDRNFTLPKTGGAYTVALVALWLLVAGLFVLVCGRGAKYKTF